MSEYKMTGRYAPKKRRRKKSNNIAVLFVQVNTHYLGNGFGYSRRVTRKADDTIFWVFFLLFQQRWISVNVIIQLSRWDKLANRKAYLLRLHKATSHFLHYFHRAA